jgi:hypothetical protein
MFIQTWNRWEVVLAVLAMWIHVRYIHLSLLRTMQLAVSGMVANVFLAISVHVILPTLQRNAMS